MTTFFANNKLESICVETKQCSLNGRLWASSKSFVLLFWWFVDKIEDEYYLKKYAINIFQNNISQIQISTFFTSLSAFNYHLWRKQLCIFSSKFTFLLGLKTWKCTIGTQLSNNVHNFNSTGYLCSRIPLVAAVTLSWSPTLLQKRDTTMTPTVRLTLPPRVKRLLIIQLWKKLSE